MFLNDLEFFKKRRRSHIRAYMRGYNILKKNNKLDLITNLKDNLANNPINKKSLQDLFINPKDICAHQFLVYRLLNYEFNKELQIALTRKNLKLKYPLPKPWRLLLEKEGLIVNTLENKLLWFGFRIKWHMIGVASVFFELIRIFKFSTCKLGAFVYFENLTSNNLPDVEYLDQNNTIINWYVNRKESTHISSILHNVKSRKPFIFKNKNIITTDSPIPSIESIFLFFYFLKWSFIYSIKALFSVQKSILFREEVLNKVFSLSSNTKTAKAYFFHNSGHLLRPLWTYEAEKKGAEIIFYFYSTNAYSLETVDNNFLQENQWQIISWPTYWVWNRNQKEFLESQIKTPSTIKICGPLPFSSVRDEIKINHNEPVLLVFDVQPVKKFFYESLGIGLEYYTSKNSIKFLKDIDEISNQLKFQILFKRKRSSSYTDKTYIRYLEKLKKTGRWLEVNPDIDALTACKIKNITGVISAPFTSTAIIAQTLGLASAYYDSTDSLKKNQMGTNQLELLRNKNELLNWIKSIE